MAPTLTHPKGRTVTVPDETVEFYTANGWTIAGTTRATEQSEATPRSGVEIPDGEPHDKWAVTEIKAYATREGIDLGEAKNKGEYLTVIADTKAAAGADEGGADGADAAEGDTVPSDTNDSSDS